MKTNAIRKAFLNYFEQQGHTCVPGASLVPHDDPSLLFTNAGMNQFKEVFVGREQRDYERACSAQRCVRAGGKHNDLDQVGFTGRHHTFFEMLGNFSFGDYFKSEAIGYAWTFLTEVLELPKEKLWVSVYVDDDESARIWQDEIGFPADRISRCGEADNFWSMGDTGPCGPCTEIFYDHGPDVAGGPPGSLDQDGDRYVEVWNLVFMQYERTADGVLHNLPKPSVDTGVGLERLAAVLQGVRSNYEIDLFKGLLGAVREACAPHHLPEVAQQVIADHIRSTVFLMLDGVVPSNEGRGYVLRRIMRRAIRFAYHAGVRETFLYQLVKPLVGLMGEAYPDLIVKQDQVAELISVEEDQFAKTLEHGLVLLEAHLENLSTELIPGDLAFQLYDTYGFPLDLTIDVARERGLMVDTRGFEVCLEAQRKKSQLSQRFEYDMQTHLPNVPATRFDGYTVLKTDSKVLGMLFDGQPVNTLSEGQSGVVILDCTPFYPEGGGQIGDQGLIESGDGQCIFQVENTQRQGECILHFGRVERGSIALDARVQAVVSEARQDVMRNHTATHLLHAALRQVLGDHVVQKGSLVEVDRLRFDFAHPKALTNTELAQIDHLVNAKIRENLPVLTDVMDRDAAKAKGAMALFGEQYGEVVRVLTIDDFSIELCGGTHVAMTGEIAVYKTVSESGVAAGVRRIEAVTGRGALAWFDTRLDMLDQATNQLKASPEQLLTKLNELLMVQKTQAKRLKALEKNSSSDLAIQLAQQAESIGQFSLVIVSISSEHAKSLRELMDALKSRLNQAIIVLACQTAERLSLVVGMNAPALNAASFAAPDVLKQLTDMMGGRGGGRPDFAQGGGEATEKLSEGLSAVRDWVVTQIER